VSAPAARKPGRLLSKAGPRGPPNPHQARRLLPLSAPHPPPRRTRPEPLQRPSAGTGRSKGSAARQVEWLPRVEGEEVRFASDSPLEEAVSSEPVSGKNTGELHRFSAEMSEICVEKRPRFSDLDLDFPARFNREFFYRNGNRNRGQQGNFRATSKGKGARSDEPDQAAASGSSQPSAPSTIAVAHMAARIICEVRSINELMLGLSV
jgi:hypothetical protein